MEIISIIRSIFREGRVDHRFWAAESNLLSLGLPTASLKDLHRAMNHEKTKINVARRRLSGLHPGRRLPGNSRSEHPLAMTG
jgi:hypothetical protein